jgi:hypothetical protein
MHRHELVVNVFSESVDSLFLFIIQFRKAKLADRVAIKDNLLVLDYRVMAVNSH